MASVTRKRKVQQEAESSDDEGLGTVVVHQTRSQSKSRRAPVKAKQPAPKRTPPKKKTQEFDDLNLSGGRKRNKALAASQKKAAPPVTPTRVAGRTSRTSATAASSGSGNKRRRLDRSPSPPPKRVNRNASTKAPKQLATPPKERMVNLESDAEGSSEDDDVEQRLVQPRQVIKRTPTSKPFQGSAPSDLVLPPTPDSSPSRRRRTTSSIKTRDTETSHDIASLLDEQSDDELQATEDLLSDSEDPLLLTTPERKRQSDRRRGLPASIPRAKDARLGINMVGFLEDDGRDSSEEPEELAEETGAEIGREEEENASGKTLYSPEVVRDVLARAGRSTDEAGLMEGYEKWESAIRYAMRGVVNDRVGNCVIVLGQRGIGKTMMIENSLASMGAEFGDDSFIPVRLNGLVHITDRQALRSIARQLKIQGFVDEDGDWGSSAATMATLLAMLEPPAGTTGAEKPVLLVLDEFDLFALHPRQSFLYCLLDIVQGNRRKAGMGVIGVSSRTDCMSLLEKRVRSRCQSQVLQVVLPNLWQSYLDHARRLLAIPLAKKEKDLVAREWNEEVEAFLERPATARYLQRLWKLHGNAPCQLVQTITALKTKLEWSTRHTTASWTSPPPSKMALPSLRISLIASANPVSSRDDLLHQRTVLELTLCVAAKQVRRDHGVLNLEMLYDCYSSHMKRASSDVKLRTYSKLEFANALDVLRELEIFLPVTIKPSSHFVPSMADGFKMLRFVPWDTALDSALDARSDVQTRTKNWSKNWFK